MESCYVVVSDSGGGSAFVVQDNEQDFARHGARRGEGKKRGRGAAHQHKRRSGRDRERHLFWIYDDKVCTVPTGRGILPGVTRAVVLEICQSLGLETNKRVIKPEALQISKGIFITQSVLGIVPVSSFDGKTVTPSPLVDQITRAYDEMLMKS